MDAFPESRSSFYLQFVVGWKKYAFGLKLPRQLGHREAAVPAGGCPVCPALYLRLWDACVIQLLLQSFGEANDLPDTGAVSVALGLESLDRLKPSSESAGVSRSPQHRGLQQRSRSVPATWV